MLFIMTRVPTHDYLQPWSQINSVMHRVLDEASSTHANELLYLHRENGESDVQLCQISFTLKFENESFHTFSVFLAFILTIRLLPWIKCTILVYICCYSLCEWALIHTLGLANIPARLNSENMVLCMFLVYISRAVLTHFLFLVKWKQPSSDKRKTTIVITVKEELLLWL